MRRGRINSILFRNIFACIHCSGLWHAFNVIAAVASHFVDSFYTFCCHCGRDFIATMSVEKEAKESWQKQATTKENRISSASKRWQRWIVEKCRLAISMWVFFSFLISFAKSAILNTEIVLATERAEKWENYENLSRKAQNHRNAIFTVEWDLF